MMISRQAECCFWMYRYVERAENCARLLTVNRSFVLDVPLADREQWWPIAVVSGEQDRIRMLLGEEAALQGEQVQEYLTWNPDNPVSIFSSVRWARENARTVREVISLEMWETINGFWHWLTRGPGRRLYNEDRDAFYRRVRDLGSAFSGTCHNTMLHEDPFDFMRLGMLLERAGWTARILDVKHHMLGPMPADEAPSPLESAHSTALLRSCSATEPFFKQVHDAPTPRRVVGFLLFAPNFPRSVLHCLDRAMNFLNRVRPASGRTGARSMTRLGELLDAMQSMTLEEVFAQGLHEELTRIIDSIADVCDGVSGDYFHPAIDTLAVGAP
ncbi:MAG: alpha-E domain-containing protein [Myxococcales bacterium]|jgi:uncharacterized alpha-E superfamily protein